MEIDDATCYRAVRSRDPRFDGRFYICVQTTGIYCRPICPAPPAKRENMRFLPCASAAEAAGFRPCRRCRPETAPGTPGWLGTPATVSRALRLIAAGALDEGNVDTLATRLGVGGRHLRRLFATHLGASPVAMAQTRRVHFARRLLDDTTLSMTQVALEAGFSSVRRFNSAIRATFGQSPSALRRQRPGSNGAVDVGIRLRLPYRPPYDWPSACAFLEPRTIPGVEECREGRYRRTVRLGDEPATIEIAAAGEGRHLELVIVCREPVELLESAERARRLCDLDADPLAIDEHLSRDRKLAPLMKKRPGLRVPGAWDPFETAVRAVLGQQISVAAAHTIAGRLAASCGRRLPDGSAPAGTSLSHLFPTPEQLADADLSQLGLPQSRQETLRRLARAVCDGDLRFDGAMALEDFVGQATRLPGIGPWSANYIAMRALGEPDAFPGGDLGLRKAMSRGEDLISARDLERRAEAWRPWRAYAAMHLWRSLADKKPIPRKRATRRRTATTTT